MPGHGLLPGPLIGRGLRPGFIGDTMGPVHQGVPIDGDTVDIADTQLTSGHVRTQTGVRNINFSRPPQC